MRFDFLHAPRPIASVAVPPAWRGTVLIAGACAAILAGVYRIESVRLSTAAALQSVYVDRLAQTEAAGRQRSRAYQNVRKITAVLDHAAAIAASARKQARVIAVVAQSLPPHVWLTSIRRDDSGLVLQGKAGELAGISALVRRLEESRLLGRPSLSSITRPEGNARTEPLIYTLHVDVAAQS